MFLSDLDLTEPAFQVLLLVIEMERSSKSLSSFPSFLLAVLANSIACLENSTIVWSSCLLACWLLPPFFLRSSLRFSASCWRVRHWLGLCVLFFPFRRQKKGFSLLPFLLLQQRFFLLLEKFLLLFFFSFLLPEEPVFCEASIPYLPMRILGVCRRL